MATQNITNGTGFLYQPGSPVHVIKTVVDLSKITASAQDVLQVLSIPAGTLVTHVHLKVLTASGGTLTAGVGDGTNPSGFITAANLNSTATDAVSALTLTEGTPNTVTGYSAGKFYAAADTIDITLSNNAPGKAGKFLLEAVCIELTTGA